MSGTRGQAAVNLFIAWALEYGDDISIPILDIRPWDVLLHIRDQEPHIWNRVQVKRVYQKQGHPTVDLVRRNGERYNKEDADFLAAVDMDEHLIYLIPWSDVCRYTRKRLIGFDHCCFEL